MRDVLERTLLAGLGLASLTTEKAQEIVDDLVRRGEVRREEAHDLVERLVQRGRQTRERLHQTIREEARKAVREMRLVTQDDLTALERKIEALEAALKERPGA